MMAAQAALPVFEVLFLFFTGRDGSFLSQTEKEKNRGAKRADEGIGPCKGTRKIHGIATPVCALARNDASISGFGRCGGDAGAQCPPLQRLSAAHHARDNTATTAFP